MKKFWRILLILLVLIIIVMVSCIQINKQIYKNRVLTYLIEEKQYERADIKDIEGHWGKLPTFYTSVMFENEPNAIYYYFAHSGVIQAGCEINGEAVDMIEAKREGKLLHLE